MLQQSLLSSLLWRHISSTCITLTNSAVRFDVWMVCECVSVCVCERERESNLCLIFALFVWFVYMYLKQPPTYTPHPTPTLIMFCVKCWGHFKNLHFRNYCYYYFCVVYIVIIISVWYIMCSGKCQCRNRWFCYGLPFFYIVFSFFKTLPFAIMHLHLFIVSVHSFFFF